MSIGIGLGAFMDGFKDGQSFMEKKADNAYRKELRQRQTDEFNRQEEMRKNIETISNDANQKFDELVKTGEKKEADRADFFRDYALPTMEGAYLKRGDLDGAKRLREWGETADAKKGAKLSQQALLALQTGDHVGALNAAVEASRLGGYYKTDFKFTGHEPFVDESGKVMGYRLKGVGADGKEFAQDVPLNKLPTLIATYINPEAAWQSHQAAAAEQAKTQKELDVYTQKKEIDRKYGSNGKGRSEAIKTLRDRYDGITGGKAFDDMTSDEKESLIAEELALQSGSSTENYSGSGTGAAPASGQPAPSSSPGLARPAPSGRQVMVDTVTGKPVATAQPRTEEAQSQGQPPDERSAPGLGQPPKAGLIERGVNAVKGELSRFEADRQARMAEARQRREAEAQQQASTKTSRPYSPARAAEDLERGADPRHVASNLRGAGVPEDAWPEAARQNLAARRSGMDPAQVQAAEERAVGTASPAGDPRAASRDVSGGRMGGLDFADQSRVIDRDTSAAQPLERPSSSSDAKANAKQSSRKASSAGAKSPQHTLKKAMEAYQAREPLGLIVKQLRDAKIPEKDWPKPILDEVKLIRREAKDSAR